MTGMATPGAALLPDPGTLLAGQIQVLERIARGAPLPTVLRSIALLVEEKDRRCACVEDRPGDLDDRAQELPVAVLGPEDASCNRCAHVFAGLQPGQADVLPPDVDPRADGAAQHRGGGGAGDGHRAGNASARRLQRR